MNFKTKVFIPDVGRAENTISYDNNFREICHQIDKEDFICSKKLHDFIYYKLYEIIYQQSLLLLWNISLNFPDFFVQKLMLGFKSDTLTSLMAI